MTTGSAKGAKQRERHEKGPSTNGAKPKPRAIELELAGGRVVVMREPGLPDLSLFLRAQPGLEAYWSANRAAFAPDPNVILPVPDLPEALMSPVWELAGRLTGLSLEEIQALSAGEGMAILSGLTEHASANFTLIPRTRSPSPAGAQA